MIKMKEQIKINYFDLGLHTANELFRTCDLLDDNYSGWRAYGFEACGLYHDFCEERFKGNTHVKIIHGAISNTEEDIKLHYANNALGHSIFESKNEEVTDTFVATSGSIDVDALSTLPSTSLPMMFNHCFVNGDFSKVTPGLSLEKIYSWVKKYSEEFQAGIPIGFTEGNKISYIDATNVPIWFQGGGLIARRDFETAVPQYEYTKGIIFSKWLKENIPDFESSFNILRVNIEGAEVHLFEDLINSDLIKHFDIFCGTGNDVEKISEHSADKYYKMLDDNEIKMYRFIDWKPELNDMIGDIIIEKVKEWKTKNVLP